MSGVSAKAASEIVAIFDKLTQLFVIRVRCSCAKALAVSLFSSTLISSAMVLLSLEL
jgi:hypothetical protein